MSFKSVTPSEEKWQRTVRHNVAQLVHLGHVWFHVVPSQDLQDRDVDPGPVQIAHASANCCGTSGHVVRESGTCRAIPKLTVQFLMQTTDGTKTVMLPLGVPSLFDGATSLMPFINEISAKIKKYFKSPAGMAMLVMIVLIYCVEACC